MGTLYIPRNCDASFKHFSSWTLNFSFRRNALEHIGHLNLNIGHLNLNTKIKENLNKVRFKARAQVQVQVQDPGTGPKLFTNVPLVT